MATLELTTQGIEAGYGEDGFFAFGTSILHAFEDGDLECGYPSIAGTPIDWRVDLSGMDLFEEYVTHTYPREKLSPRVPILKEFFREQKTTANGKLHRWNKSQPIKLSYSFPPDPSLASVIMGAIVAERDLVIWGDWSFLTEEKLAPAATVEGFMNRGEPAFTLKLPTLRVRQRR